ncbi:MAG: hypothetical protein KDB27_02280 [Planctomycetales bacterium]|nr:hypothetical protein [Planctomycetales bacterium]
MDLDLVLRWVHILSAIALVGGAFFTKFAFVPGMSAISDGVQREAVASQIRGKWSKVVMATSGLLLISGLINVMGIISTYGTNFDGPYHALVGIKLLLALAVFALSAILSGRSSTAQKLRQNESKWATINLLLAVAVVCVAGYMKSIDRTPKSDASLEEPTAMLVTVDSSWTK